MTDPATSAPSGAAAAAPPEPARRRRRLQARVVPGGPVVARKWCRVLLVAGIVVFAAYCGITAYVAHHRFNTYGYDTGIFDQGLWLLSRFQTPFITFTGRHLFGDHTSFLLVALVPLYWLGASVDVLFVVQAVALGLAAWPVFLIGRDLLRDERPALLLAAAFLLHPALMWLGRDEFHPDAFEVPLLAFALWFMLRRRWAGFFTFVGLALLVKEDVALLTFGLGIYVAIRYSRRVGLVTAAVSAAYFVVAVWVVLRHFNGVGSLNAWRIPFGGLGGLFATTFTHPGQVVAYALSEGRAWYLWQMAAPLALAPLLAPGALLIALGPILGNLLSNFWYQHSIRYHYGTLILPVLALATALGVSCLRRRAVRVVAGAAILVAGICGTAFWGPPVAARYYGGFGAAPTVATIREALEQVPPDAVVASYHRLSPHLSHRTAVYDLPNPFRAAYWGLGDLDGRRLPQADTVEYVVVPAHALEGELDKFAVAEIRADFETIYDAGGMLVLRRVDPEG